jgi:IS30 family transposase
MMMAFIDAHREIAKLAANGVLGRWVEERLSGAVAKPGDTPVTGPTVSWKGRRHGPRKNRRWSKAWSPEQIAKRLPIDFPDDDSMRISHEAIYQALAGHGAEAVRDAITRTITALPEELRRSLTWDQGAEMAQHARLTVDAGVQVYFCDPQSPWQRGTNENTNGLLRQYFPKAPT